MGWNPIYLVITIVSIGIAIYFGRKSIRKKEPFVAYFREKVLGIGANAPVELKLLFNDIQVSDVYRTRFLIFNKGKLAIRKSDIVDGITIIFDSGEILGEPVIKCVSNESVKFRAIKTSQDNKYQIELDFDYLNEKDGAVIEVLHTEDSNTSTKARLIDVEKITEIKNIKPFIRWRMRYYFYSFIGFCGLLGWGVYEITHGEVNTSPANGVDIKVFYPIMISLGVAWLLTFLPDVKNYIRYYSFPKWSREFVSR